MLGVDPQRTAESAQAPLTPVPIRVKRPGPVEPGFLPALGLTASPTRDGWDRDALRHGTGGTREGLRRER